MSDTDARQIEATVGPYRGQRLTVSAADADAAIADKWAIDPFAPVEHEPDEAPEPLSEEERVSAHEAALAWSAAQQKAASGEDNPAPEQTRAMGAETPKNYKTRQHR